VADSYDSWLQEGIAAARSGQIERARTLLTRVVRVDERNVQAWYWLSRIVQDPREREVCLENVLQLDPAHTAVQAELADLRRQMTAAAQAPLPSREAIEAAIPHTAAEQLASDAAVEPLFCPYCAAPTAAGDRLCPACGRTLTIREPKSKGHSVYSLTLAIIWLAVANYAWLTVAGSYFLSCFSCGANASPGTAQTFETLGRLLGIEPSAAPVRDLRWTPVVLAGGVVFLLSLVIAWGLYRRLRFFYWLTVALVLLSPLAFVYWAAVADAVPLWGLLAAGVLFMLAISLAFMAYDEYAWVERRLAAVLDADVDSASSLYARGREVAGQGMWARAAVHWAKAVALSPGHPDYRVALARAYINLGRPEQALDHLRKVQQIEPTYPHLDELIAQAGGSS